MAVLAATSALIATSCILLVPAHEYGSSCAFANAGAVCGACLARECQPAIDQCCRSDGCTSTLPDLDACAGGDREACGRLLDRMSSVAASNDDASLSLAQCISKSCAPACPYTVGTVTRCAAPVLGSGATCHCDVSAQPNALECSRGAFPDTLCCAPDNWPSDGQRCSCLKWACSSNTVECSCLLGETWSPSDSPECTGANCCSDGDMCQCSSLPCRKDQRQVPSCSLSFAECAKGTHPVDRCTVDAR